MICQRFALSDAYIKVEIGGLEPLTYALRTRRSPS